MTVCCLVFILNQLKDFEKVKKMGLDAYQSELNGKVGILRNLLDNYNDGRQKNFFCIAVNLLELDDVKHVMEEITYEVKPEGSVKEKSAIAVRLFQSMADQRGWGFRTREEQAAAGAKIFVDRPEEILYYL